MTDAGAIPPSKASPPGGARVGLFVTCLVDLVRPSVGFAALKLLEDAGCRVDRPVRTCCGQPADQSGDRVTARDLAERAITAFEDVDTVVVPSGSCAGMIKTRYPDLFGDDPNWRSKAEGLASKTYELTSFLVDVLGVTRVEAAFAGRVTYHDSCSGLRELGVRDQPRRLLQGIAGLELVEMNGSEACCGFGCTFGVKSEGPSGASVSGKAKAVVATSAPALLGGDLGCLLTLAGELSRQGAALEVRHVAEVLAGMTAEPPIGGPRHTADERPHGPPPVKETMAVTQSGSLSTKV